MAETAIDLYTDIKSPYAYLAVEPARALARDYRVALNWLPYTLEIPDFLGSAEVDGDGRVVAENRSPHQWRRVRYSYMDVRRYANLRGLTVRGPRKIWDSSLAHAGLLYAKAAGAGVLDAYLDATYARFWRRELDIEDAAAVSGVLAEAGADAGGFAAWAAGPGRAEHDRVRRAAEAAGVFGVPTYVLDGEIYWGREHLSLIRARLEDAGLRRPGAAAPAAADYAWRGESAGRSA